MADECSLDQYPLSDDGDIAPTKPRSKVPRAGRKATTPSIDVQNETSAPAQTLGEGHPGLIPVYWPLGDETWKATPEDVQKRGIAQYRLYDTGFGIWRYKLEIINTQNNNFLFWDESGDYYGINTFTKGEHSVKYNSNKPTIMFIH